MLRRETRALAGMVSILLFLGGCQTLKVRSDYDRQASFAGFHSFTWLARDHHGNANPLTVQRVHDAVQAELIRKGFVYVSDGAQADFVVDFTIGSRERIEVNSYPAPFVGSYWGPGWWGYGYWGNAVDVRQYREGTLSIDVFDARTHRAVWHGWAQKELSRADIEHSEKPIQEAVDAVLARFPPG